MHIFCMDSQLQILLVEESVTLSLNTVTSSLEYGAGVDMLIFSFLPWLCLAISNSLLVWKLKASVREAEVQPGI